MLTTRKEFLDRRSELQKSIQEIVALGDDVTEEQLGQAEAFESELNTVEQSLEKFAKIEALKARIVDGVGRPSFLDPSNQVTQKDNKVQVPAEYRRLRIKNFTGDDEYSPQEKSYLFGHWMLASIGGLSKSKEICEKAGIVTKTQLETQAALGGYLVPEQFSTDYIRLVESYGVGRTIVGTTPMTSDTLTIPRRAGGVTAYWAGENDALTESNMTFNNVTLVAKKLTALNYLTTELSEDAILSVADRVIEEMAQAFAEAEDDAIFNGDATSTYGGINGFRNKLKNVDGTIANIKGLQVGTGNLYSELTVPDFAGVVGRLPQYASSNPVWVCSRKFYFDVMVKLLQTTGGLTPGQLSQGDGVASMNFLGFPVKISQKMPTTEANSQVCALFGDFPRASKFGVRGSTSLAMSEHYRFNQDAKAIRMVQRVDFSFHDPGDTTNAGPVVGLITAAS